MSNLDTLKISRKIKSALEEMGATYHGGSYGNTNSSPDEPILFRLNCTMDGEKFQIQIGLNDFDLGPFAEPETHTI